MQTHQLNVLEGEAGFRVLFQYATISILVVGTEGKIELANPCAQDLFGYTSAELIGQPLEILIPSGVRHKHTHHRESYFSRPKARPMGYGLDLHAQKKNGDIFPVEISLGHYELDGKRLAVAFVTDITKRKEFERELKAANEELERRVEERTIELTDSLDREKKMNEMKSRFVSMASHEFRTPLSAILSSIALVEQYTQPDQAEKRKKHVERIKSSVKNLTAILNDFLSLDKLEQGKVEVESSTFNLQEFAEDIIEEVRGILKAGQRIDHDHQGEPVITQDKKMLRNVMLNLLSNAIKYSPEDKTISLCLAADDSGLLITVSDQGIGIPEEEQEQLFGRFFRATNSTTIQGTGLGLNIVKRYVELMEGSISFTSKQGEGTSFFVKLPNHAQDSSH